MWALFKPDLNRLKATRFEFSFGFCKISGYELNRAGSRSVLRNGIRLVLYLSVLDSMLLVLGPKDGGLDSDHDDVF